MSAYIAIANAAIPTWNAKAPKMNGAVPRIQLYNASGDITIDDSIASLPYFAAFRFWTGRPENKLALWGDSLTAGSTGFPAGNGLLWRERLSTQLGADVGIDSRAVGGNTSADQKTVFDAQTSLHQYRHVFAVGSNNGWGVYANAALHQAALDSLLTDLAAMVAALGHTNYLVVGPLARANGGGSNWSGTEADQARARVAVTYEAVRQLAGARFVDLKAALVAASDGSTADNLAIASGYTPDSLRVDEIHLNTAGQNAFIAALNAVAVSVGFYPHA